MELTRDEVEFRAAGAPDRGGGGGMSARRRSSNATWQSWRVTQPRVLLSEWTKLRSRALDALVAARRDGRWRSASPILASAVVSHRTGARAARRSRATSTRST